MARRAPRLAFLLVGAGLHTTQTAGLALASDLAPEHARPRVVALLYVMLLLGMVLSALIFGFLLQDFTPVHLIQIIQGAAVITFVLNGIALWKQEPRNPALTDPAKPRISFAEAWRGFAAAGRSKRLLVAVGLGTAGFSMQDILLEPFGGQVFGMGVGQTTWLTAILAGGTLLGFALSANLLSSGSDPYRIASLGVLAGIAAFAAVIFAPTLQSRRAVQNWRAHHRLWRRPVRGRHADGGHGSGVKRHERHRARRLGRRAGNRRRCRRLRVSGAVRDGISTLAERGVLGEAFQGPGAGYIFVYHFEIVLLFATLIAIGPLVRVGVRRAERQPSGFGLAEYPG